MIPGFVRATGQAQESSKPKKKGKRKPKGKGKQKEVGSQNVNQKNTNRGGKGKGQAQTKKPAQKQSLPLGPCYILSIPEDILIEIFVRLNLPETMHTKQATRITSVCRQWRTFVLSTPLFWQKITVPLSKHKPCPSTYDPFVNSGAAALDVTLNNAGNGVGHKILGRTCDAFAAHLPRFRSLTATVTCKEESNALFRKWTQYPPTNLVFLQVQIFLYNLTIRTPPLSLPSGITFSSLTSLTLAGEVNIDFQCLPVAPNLQHLDLVAAPPGVKEFEKMLDKYPKLEELILQYNPRVSTEKYDHRGDPRVQDGVYSTRSLHTFALSLPHFRNGYPYLAKILKNVKCVEISNPGLDNGTLTAKDFRGFVRQWNTIPTLEYFRLHLGNSVIWDDPSFTSSLPAGVHLEIDHPPSGSESTLVKILNSNRFKSITVILSERDGIYNIIDPAAFASLVCKSNLSLRCPTTIVLPNHSSLDKKTMKALGAQATTLNLQNHYSQLGLINPFPCNPSRGGLFEDSDSYADEDYAYGGPSGIFNSHGMEFVDDPYDSDFGQYRPYINTSSSGYGRSFGFSGGSSRVDEDADWSDGGEYRSNMNWY